MAIAEDRDETGQRRGDLGLHRSDHPRRFRRPQCRHGERGPTGLGGFYSFRNSPNIVLVAVIQLTRMG